MGAYNDYMDLPAEKSEMNDSDFNIFDAVKRTLQKQILEADKQKKKKKRRTRRDNNPVFKDMNGESHWRQKDNPY